MITLNGITEDGVSVPVQVTEDGKLVVMNSGIQPGEDIDVGNVTASGSISAAGSNVLINDNKPIFTIADKIVIDDANNAGTTGSELNANGSVKAASGKFYIDWGGGVYLGPPPLDQAPFTNRVISLNQSGSIDAAGGKCGFTSSGDLVFTSRGERYRIIVQQGVCYADPYPKSKEIQEKLDRVDTTDIVLPD